MNPKPSHYKVAKRIIQSQGLTFSLASISGKRGDLEIACDALEQAIANALAAESERVHRLTPRHGTARYCT